MLIAFSMIGILVLLLVYFVVHSQSLQRELTVTRNSSRQNAKKASRALTNLVLLSGELQKVYQGRLETAHSKGLMQEKQYPVAKSILRHFSQVLMDCCEKGSSFEEAMNKALQMDETNMDAVKEFIKGQPREVRVAWMKNSPEGYVAACNNFTQKLLLSEKSDPAE